MDVEADRERGVLENAPEDQFAYAASDVFSIVSPYVFHTHAPRVFSEISGALRRAQEASADVVVRLEASELAQKQERKLRAREARLYVARLRELQTLMMARVEREIAGAKARKSLKRKLGAETSRSAELEKRLADAEEALQHLRKEFDAERGALDERWRTELDRAVGAAREAERARASVKVEALTVKRLRSLSSQVTKLKGNLQSLQAENASLLETLQSCIPPPSDSPSSFQRRAEKELRRLSAAAAAEQSKSAESASRGASPDSTGNYSGHSGSGLSDVVSGLAERIRRSISERASELGLPQRGSRRRFFSDEEDDGSYGFSSPESTWQRRGRQLQQQPRAARRAERGGATATDEGARLPSGGAYRSVDDEVDDVRRRGAAAAAADFRSPSFGGEKTHRASICSGGSSSSSGRRRGLGSIRRLSFDAADARAGRSHAHDPARDWAPSQGGGPAAAKPTSGAETLKSSSRWQHQRPLGGGDGGGSGETGAGSNAPSLHALLALGEFYPAGGEIADGGKRASPGRQHPAGSSFRWSGGRGTVELRDHNNKPSRFAGSGEGCVVGDKSRLEKDGDEQEEGEEERAAVEASAQEDGSDGGGGGGGGGGVASTCAGGEDDAGGVAAETVRAGEAHLAQDDDDDGDLTTSEDNATGHGDITCVFSPGAGQASGSSRRGTGAANTCGGGVDGIVGDSGPRDRAPVEPTAAHPEEGSLLCSTFSAGVHGGANNAGKGGGDGSRGKRLDNLFPPTTGASAEEVGAVTTVATREDGGKQRPGLDDLLRDMAVAVPVEGPGEGDSAGGSVVTALPHRAEFMDVVLA